MKRLKIGFIFLFLLMLFLSQQIIALENESFKNTIYGGFSIQPIPMFNSVTPWHTHFGANIEYERSLNNLFSVSLAAGIGPWADTFAEIKGRLFPFRKTFFLGLGIGIGFFSMDILDNCLLISPTFGWKISIGNQNRFFIMPNLITRFELYPSALFDKSPYPSVLASYDMEGYLFNISVGYSF